MTHDELVHSLELERLDRTFWRMGAATYVYERAESQRQRTAAQATETAEERRINERRLALLGAVGPELTAVSTGSDACGLPWVDDKRSPSVSQSRDDGQPETSTSIGAA